MAYDPEEEQYAADDAWSFEQPITPTLLRLFIREELLRLNLIPQEDRDKVARTYGEESGLSV